jgi:hypothetical protein
VLKGAAIIEVAEADKNTPIHVATGNLRTVIVSPGLYRFSGDTPSSWTASFAPWILRRSSKKENKLRRREIVI